MTTNNTNESSTPEANASGNTEVISTPSETFSGSDGETRESIKVTSTSVLDSDGKVVQPVAESEDSVQNVDEGDAKVDQTEKPSDPNDILAEHQKVAGEVKEKLVDSGFNMDELGAEWDANGGKLTEETVKKLEEKGYSRELQEAVIEGQKAKVSRAQDALYKAAGGSEDDYNAVWDWASTNLSDGEKNRIKEFYDNNDLSAIQNSIYSIKYKMSMDAEENRPAPVKQTVQGQPKATQGSSVESYRTNEEMQQAFQDPRYRTSNDYRSQVEARVLATQRTR